MKPIKAKFNDSKIPFALYSWFLIACISCVFLITNRLKPERWKEVIISDGTGYYSYLPALFIYNDLNYNYFYSDSLEYNAIKIGAGAFCYPVNSKAVNKYYFGEALAISPFFFLADFITVIINNVRDGYSFYYQASVAIAGLFYFLFGLWMLILFLRKKNVKEFNIAITILLFYLGTNLFYYALEQPYMSHIYSFSFVCCWLNVSNNQVINYKNYRWLLLALIGGFIILIRPVNIILLLSVFIIYPDFNLFISHLKKLILNPFILIGSILILFSFILIQSLLYYKACGLFWVDAYGAEGFNFNSPEIINVLFSFRKGLFIYSPMLILILFGFFYFKIKYGFKQLIILLIILCLFTYVVSSWWYWAYGGSYGMRPFIEVYPIFIWVFAISFEFISNWILKIFLILFSAFCILLNQVQIYQSLIGILPYENMNFDKYKRLFFQTGIQFRYMFSSLPEPSKELLVKGKMIGMNFNGFEENYGSIVPFVQGKIKSEGKHSVCINSNNGTAAQLLEFPLYKLIGKEDTLEWIVVNADIMLENIMQNSSLILSVSSNNEAYIYQTQYLIHGIDEEKKWKNVNLYFQVSEIKSLNDILRFTLDNNNQSSVFVDKFKVTFYSK